MIRDISKMMKKIIMTVLVITVTIAVNAWSKDLFVSPTGSDSVSYTANDLTHPWNTVA